jgi:hypothetical protein
VVVVNLNGLDIVTVKLKVGLPASVERRHQRGPDVGVGQAQRMAQLMSGGLDEAEVIWNQIKEGLSYDTITNVLDVNVVNEKAEGM